MNPTHALLDDDREIVGLVFPEGTAGELVELPEGFWARPHLWDKATSTFVEDLPAMKVTAWEKVKALRASKLVDAPTDYGTAQTDVESMVKINGLVSMAMVALQAGRPLNETFTMADNSEVPLRANDIIAFGIEVGGHVSAVHERARELRAAINSASSGAALEAINLEAGW